GFIRILLTDPAVLISPVQIVAGVRLGRRDCKEISSSGLRNVSGNGFRITGSGVIDHQNIAVAGRLSSIRSRGGWRRSAIAGLLRGRGGRSFLALAGGLTVISAITLPTGCQGQGHYRCQGQTENLFPGEFHSEAFLSK